jgi:hypothetical protein
MQRGGVGALDEDLDVLQDKRRSRPAIVADSELLNQNFSRLRRIPHQLHPEPTFQHLEVSSVRLVLPFLIHSSDSTLSVGLNIGSNAHVVWPRLHKVAEVCHIRPYPRAVGDQTPSIQICHEFRIRWRRAILQRVQEIAFNIAESDYHVGAWACQLWRFACVRVCQRFDDHMWVVFLDAVSNCVDTSQ